MVIGQIGAILVDIEQIDFRGHSSFFDYDLIIMDLHHIIRQFGVTNTETPESIVVISNFEDECKRRFDELKIYLNHGKKLVIIIPAPKKINQLVKNTSIEDFCPFFSYKTVKYTGRNYDILESPFKDFFLRQKKYLSYKSYVDTKPQNVIAKVKEIDKCISFYERGILFIPEIDQSINRGLLKVERNTFLYDLEKCMSVIETDDVIIKTGPVWLNNYHVFNERDLINDRIKLTEEIAKIEANVRNIDNKLLSIKEFKTLLSSGGKDLELIVRSCLEEIGFEILETKEGRDDLRLKYLEQYFVIEIKGLTKSAAEKNAAQLEKWSSEFHLEMDFKPKAILIVNAFKDKPLQDRTEDVFPNQMLKFSSNREHCLMSTTQLLGAMVAFRNNETSIDELVNSLTETNGVYPHYLDWNKFINIESAMSNPQSSTSQTSATTVFAQPL